MYFRIFYPRRILTFWAKLLSMVFLRTHAHRPNVRKTDTLPIPIIYPCKYLPVQWRRCHIRCSAVAEKGACVVKISWGASFCFWMGLLSLPLSCSCGIQEKKLDIDTTKSPHFSMNVFSLCVYRSYTEITVISHI